MIGERLIYLFIATAIIGNAISAESHGCKDIKKSERKPDFYRVFTYIYDGPPAAQATEEDLIRIIGPCVNMDDFLEDMFGFFSSFGFNMTIPRESPFTSYASPIFNLDYLIVENPSGRIVLGSFYEFGEYMDSPIFDGFTRLITHMDITFENGTTLPALSTFLYGYFRMRVHGENKCMTYSTVKPLTATFKERNFHVPLDLALESKEWGKGSALGALRSKQNDTRFDIGMVMTFPPMGH